MTTSAKPKKILEPPQLSAVIGALGAVGEISTFFIKHPALAIAMGSISSLFILIFGLIERKNQRPAIKSLAILFIIVGPVILILLLALGYILFFSSPPSSIGRDVTQASSVFQLQSDGLTDTLAGKHSLEFCCEADWAEIGFMPSHEDRVRIKEINVIKVQAPSGQADRVFELDKTDSKTEAYFGIERPSPRLNIYMDFKVTLETPDLSPKARLFVFQSYAKRDWVWRIKKWVFEYYQRPLQ